MNRIAAALSRYDVALGQPAGRPVVRADRLARTVEHAWTTFQHAHYPQVTALVPELLAQAQHTYADEPGAGRSPLLQAYRVTASLLTKLGAGELAWFSADRAMGVAAEDRKMTAIAAIQVSQALRACGRNRAATSAALHAAYRVMDDLSLRGALLIHAALATARRGDDRKVAELLGEADALADRVGDGHDHHRTGFGPTAVMLARAHTALDLRAGQDAVAWHEKAIIRDGWRWLAAEHRAGHLVQAARAYLQIDQAARAGRALADAAHLAPAELRHRPLARAVLAEVVRSPHAPTTVIQLAATLGVA